MDCPFKEQLVNGSMVCDYGGVRHEPDVEQCPTEIFNRCQGDEAECDEKELLLSIIRAHNAMIETIQNADMKCNLFRGMEVWHKIACEGADITHLARKLGIEAKVNMQTGVITVHGSSKM